MSISYPTDLVANSNTFYLVDEGELRGVARSITTFSNGALATTYPNNARVKVGSMCIATDLNQVYVCTDVANYNNTTGWTSVGISYTAGQLMSLSGNAIAFVGGTISGGNVVVTTSSGNQWTFRGSDSSTPTITLEGTSGTGWAKLYFNPHNGLDSYIDTRSNSKFYFQTNGVGTTYYDATQWYFTLPTIITPNLSSSGSALQITPAFASTSNGILIGSSSSSATTRALSITTALTGATSNALSITSSVTSVSALGRVMNVSPTLVASANNDVLQTLYLNPTFTLGAFTGVTRYSIFSNNGQTYYNSGDITTTNNPAHFFTFNGNTGVGNVTTGFVISGTSTASATDDILFDVRDNTTSRFLVTRSAGVTFGTTTINFPNNASLTTSGSASTLIISLGNNRMLNASSTGSANTGTTFKNFSHSHTAGASSPNTGNYTTLLLQDTYNFSASTSGSPVARSLYINPTYTASAGSSYWAIEVVRGNLAFNTTSGAVFFGGNSAVSSTTQACVIISKRLDQAQMNFNPLTSAIASSVSGDIWFDSNTNNLWMKLSDALANSVDMKFLTYFNSTPTTQTSIASGTIVSGVDTSGDALGVPDSWIEINNAGTQYFIPLYQNP